MDAMRAQAEKEAGQPLAEHDLAAWLMYPKVLNTFIRPVLFVLTLPVNVLTLGLFTLVLNGLMFWVTSCLVDRFCRLKMAGELLMLVV